jgi:hypothetical protein
MTHFLPHGDGKWVMMAIGSVCGLSARSPSSLKAGIAYP